MHKDGHAARCALLEIIDGAQQSIDLCIFILARDPLGNLIVDRLSAKAREGLHVRWLLDGLGYLMAGCPNLRRLRQSGASVTLFASPLTTPLRGGIFVPESALLMALCLAARRGAAVELLLPAQSNHRLSDWARSRATRALAQAGGKILLTTQMSHAKLVVVDDLLALTGSANIDSRSLFLNCEMMVAFHRRTDVQRHTAWFEHAQLPAHRYVPTPPGILRDVAEGMLLWLGFQL